LGAGGQSDLSALTARRHCLKPAPAIGARQTCAYRIRTQSNLRFRIL